MKFPFYNKSIKEYTTFVNNAWFICQFVYSVIHWFKKWCPYIFPLFHGGNTISTKSFLNETYLLYNCERIHTLFKTNRLRLNTQCFVHTTQFPEKMYLHLSPVSWWGCHIWEVLQPGHSSHTLLPGGPPRKKTQFAICTIIFVPTFGKSYHADLLISLHQWICASVYTLFLVYSGW